jgi:hypothetical protein
VNDLTATELRVLNNVTDVLNPDVNLGTKIQTVINSLVKSATPVNAVNAAMVLTLTGVVIDGEKVTLGTDVYEFLADTEQTKTNPANIAVSIVANTVKAAVTLTVDTQPTSGNTMTIGTRVYTFVPVGTDTADREISIGADLAGAQANIVAAINGTDEFNIAHPLVSAGEFSSDDCVITAFIGGTAGNSIVSTETFTAGTNVFSDVTLLGGLNCSAANAIIALVAEVTAHDTAGIGAADGDGDTINLTADVAGAAANAIVLAETLANGSFAGAATHMAGGVDGTVGVEGALMVDATYLYATVVANTVSGKNWRRISLGSAY